MRRFLIASAVALSPAGATLAGDFALVPPIDCEVGEDKQCYIQVFKDNDPGPGVRDYRCNALSYDGHKGTDFALRSLADMRAGVAVIAPAPGVVTAVRDGMADKYYTPADAARIDGRDCGNGGVINHGGGWVTQLCHMLQGSVTAQKGNRVETGDTLGFVGLSGRTTFPHVHISVRKDGTEIDPYAPNAGNSCGTPDPANDLWPQDIAYQPTGMIAAGFATGLPDYAEIKDGTAHSPAIPRSAAPALALWGYAFGGQPGDVMRLEIRGPNGTLVYEKDTTLDKPLIQYFRAGGRKTAGADWFVPGIYTGTVSVFRDGKRMSDTVTTTRVDR